MRRNTTGRPYWPHSEPEPAEPQAPRPTFGPCPARCNRDWRDATDAYNKAINAWVEAGCKGDEPNPVAIEPWRGEPVMCRRCAGIARNALRDLPQAYDALATVKFLTHTASADEERRGRSDVPPSPSPGADHQDEIYRTVASWENDLRQYLRHQAAADTGEQRADLGASVDYLNRNWHDMIEREGCAGDFAEEIVKLFRAAVAMVKNRPIRRTLPVACPTCEMETLIQEEGIAGKPWYVECSGPLGGCSRLFTENEYEYFIRLVKDGHVVAGAAA